MINARYHVGKVVVLPVLVVVVLPVPVVVVLVDVVGLAVVLLEVVRLEDLVLVSVTIAMFFRFFQLWLLRL